MRKNSREYKIFQSGCADETWDPSEFKLLAAMARMIATATAKPVQKKKRSTTERMPINEQGILKGINYDLQVTQPGRLNGVLSRINLLPDDQEHFIVWFNQRFYPWASKEGVEVTYQMLCRKMPEWLAKARQYILDPNDQFPTEKDYEEKWR